MNIKEAFRYQKYLGRLLENAMLSVDSPLHCVVTTRTHLRKKVNPDAEDEIEVVDVGDFFKNDDVIDFMLELVAERDELSIAIGRAKSSIQFDLDAAVETNKFRQLVFRQVQRMLQTTASKSKDQWTDYKFNADGNQAPYKYEVVIESREAFDRGKAKATVSEISALADKISSEIDAAMINTFVNYDPPFDVNGSFDDAMEEFLREREVRE